MLRQYDIATADSLQVLLDDKPLQTPAGQAFVVPTPKLAAAIAAEWQTQPDKIDPRTMPLTQLAMTAQDRVALARGSISEAVLKYLPTELICHYSDKPETAAFQRGRWQALHAWLKEKYGVVLPVTTAITPLPESDTAWAALRVAEYDAFRLTALSHAVAVSGSFVIGLALCEGAISVEKAVDAAEAEADFQAQKWGEDDELVRRRTGIHSELRGVDDFVKLLA